MNDILVSAIRAADRDPRTMKRAGWTDCTLGDVVTLRRGHDLPDPARRQGSVPILGSFGVTGHHDQPKAPGPGVTVGRSGASFGVVAYTAVPYWPLNTALYVTDFHGNHALRLLLLEVARLHLFQFGQCAAIAQSQPHTSNAGVRAETN